jgi:succinate-semialdehyde dehydrogenase/glutarate-semialdehyde dehydrogenase
VCPTPFDATACGGVPRGRILAMNEAVSMCNLIMLWNFPIPMITRMAGPALMAGCTVVLKPSNLTPLMVVALSVLAKRAGIPGGVFELITADQTLTVEVGEEMCSNCNMRKILFTGSTPVSKVLMKLSGNTVKRLSLELGCNATFICEPPNAINLHMVNLKRKSNCGM